MGLRWRSGARPRSPTSPRPTVQAPEEDLPIPDVDMAFEAHNPSRDALRQMVWQEVCYYHPELRESADAEADVQA